MVTILQIILHKHLRLLIGSKSVTPHGARFDANAQKSVYNKKQIMLVLELIDTKHKKIKTRFYLEMKIAKTISQNLFYYMQRHEEHIYRKESSGLNGYRNVFPAHTIRTLHSVVGIGPSG